MAAVALFAAPSYGCSAAHASDIFPSDYCYQTDIAITYGGAGTLTNQPVRVQLNADGLIDSGQLDPRAWDVKPILGSLANEVHLTAQSLGSTTSPWWIVVPEISGGETRTHRLYSGSPEQRRDQGVYFTGGEVLTVADHADLDITNNLSVQIRLTNFDDTARQQWIVSKIDGAGGYAALFSDNAGQLAITLYADAGTCMLNWDSSWTGVPQDFRFEYTSAAGADTFIYRNDTLACSADTDKGALDVNALDMLIGARSDTGTQFLVGAAVHDVKVYAAGVLKASYGFDATAMTETVATNPFEGTVDDYSGNSHTATYVFDRDQSDFTYTVGATQLVSGAEQITLPDSNPDVLGPAFGIDPSSTPSEVTTGAFYTVFLDKWAGASPVRSFGYAAILSFIGLMMAVGAYKLTRYIPISLFMFGMPLAIGVGNGWITPWWMILWVIVAIGGWFAQRYTETA